MDTSSFDPTRAVVFDLNRGQVALSGGGSVLLVPTQAITELCGELEPASVRQLGVSFGKQAGARVRARLGASAVPSLEVIVDQLGGELALAGLGSLAIERWGQALVVRIENCPLGPQGQELMSAYIESALYAVVAREVIALGLERKSQSFRLLLCGKAASVRVKGFLSSGGSWGDALVALHQTATHDVPGARV
jgi:hypothetical protein